ncbi:MAG TPA: diacylglycerol kinase family protein [Saprospiraceae bacterium]|nr:diacylglycerol kinase family protein [Saprospiraceae bacterium]
MGKRFSFRDRIKSFSFAFAGLKSLFAEEHNAYLHLAASFGVVLMGFYWRISAVEWMAIIFCIGIVFSMEIINSSIEALADHVTPEKHKAIKKVKDLAAAAVLVSAIMSLVIGLLIFIPKWM